MIVSLDDVAKDDMALIIQFCHQHENPANLVAQLLENSVVACIRISHCYQFLFALRYLCERLVQLIPSPSAEQIQYRPYQIIVHILSGQRVTLQWGPRDTIATVKALIFEKYGVSQDDCYLLYLGRHPSDNSTLAELGITNYSTLHVAVLCRGDIGQFGSHSNSVGRRWLDSRNIHQSISSMDRVQLIAETTSIHLKTNPDLVATDDAPASNPFTLFQRPTTLTPAALLTLRSHLERSYQQQLLVGSPPTSDSSSSHTFVDFQMRLDASSLEVLVGAVAWQELQTMFRSFPGAGTGVCNAIRLRRVEARGSGGACIPFHLDRSRRTMQVMLCDESEYDGGRLVFLSPQFGLQCPVRSLGTITLHDHTLVHGVTPLTRGVRYSLFLLQQLDTDVNK